jgi:Zn-dependent protease with chaperone function
MDFFQNQEKARKRTGLLVVLFLAAVVLTIVTVYLAIAAILVGAGHTGEDAAPSDVVSRLWDPSLFLMVAGGTVALVSGGSLFKIASLSGGGHTVADLLGGRLVGSDTTDRVERRVLNVVEEMAIASGTPVPPVYIMEREAGINAFAAGYTPADAVIGVTRGCAEHLSRDELQGVIAHEFSHILNGDMRLNIRLMGVLFGILLIGLTGWMILRSQTGVRLGARNDDRKGGNPLPLIGLALYVIGYVGVFFGNLIKAAVSRQREFLADASAVQFTRNPEGIAGALKKIGALAEGSRVENPEATEASHMFFGQAIGGIGTLFGLLATHPPLVVRIRRIDPQFDGDFSKVSLAPPPSVEPPRPKSAKGSRGRTITINPAEAIRQVGTIDAAGLAYAAELAAGIPAQADALAREPYSARAVIYALLVDRENAGVQKSQLDDLARRVEPTLLKEIRAVLSEVEGMDPEKRLPLVELTVPALRRMSRAQYDEFVAIIRSLVQADRKVSLFEYALQRHLIAHLAVQYGGKPKPAIAYTTPAPLVGPVEIVLSGLAHAGEDDLEGVARAFNAGVEALGWGGTQPNLLSEADVGIDRLDAALDTLKYASPVLKKQILHACATCIGVDRTITLEEGEMLRAVSDALDCPMPPLGAGATAHDG